MEEKRRDSTGTPPTPAIDGHTPTSEPLTSSRRRGGAQKRKSGSINSTDPPATSSKRQAREKTPVAPFSPIHLNGPFTRARVQPNNGTSLSLEAADLKVESEAKAEELRRVSENWEELEADIEAEYEAIISRDANAHVVPIHAGWFSWNKIHTLEERMMPSFFNGKLESRTPEIYMEIRNWIMKKFHFNPNSQIELEQLSEFTVGDSNARQEVMEFLDYWGLINYHPFPKNEPVAAVTVVDDDVDGDEARKPDSLVEKLFQFETVESWTPVVTRTNTEMPSLPSGLLPDSVIAEELNKSEGPSVGYHCNSCSTDCSRKRYHCQKQADFDLCAECFNNGKFGSDMSVSDFILMESAEAGGVSGGKWTDQETLLLLEAIELFRDNWSEIAEHVATKTKAQCILHFVQMPIGDVFFNSDDENDVVPEENGLQVSITTENSSPKADHDTYTDVKDFTEKTENEGDATDNQALSSPMEIPKPEVVDGSDKSLEFMEIFTQKALKDAFEAVGSLSSPGDKLSFAEAGNPVMVLAAFLVRLVEPNIASASVHSFLKALSAKHSSEELAARHCLPLEDPPDDKKKLADSEGAATETVEDKIQKHGNEHVEMQNEETPDSAVEGISIQDDDKEDKGKKDVSSEQKLVASTSSDKSKFPRKQSLKDAEASGVSGGSHAQLNFNHVKESDNGGSAMELCRSEAPPKDKNSTSNSEKEDTESFLMSNSATEKEKRTGDKEAKEHDGKKKNSLVTKNDLDINKLKRAASTALSAAAVKAKLLADEEESQIHQLAILLVEKQLHKLETKLAFFGDLENVVLRVKEQLDRSKQRLFQERAQIIATRLGMPASARPNSHHLPPNRATQPASNFPNQGLRPLMGTNTLRPPISRPTMAPNPASITLMPINAAGSSMQPNSDKFSSFGAK